MANKFIGIKNVNLKVGMKFNADKHKETPGQSLSVSDKARLDNAIKASIKQWQAENKLEELG